MFQQSQEQVQAHISKTYEKKRTSDDMLDEDYNVANTTGDKDRKRKNPINTIVLSDENLDQPEIGQFRPPEGHDAVMNICPPNMHHSS